MTGFNGRDSLMHSILILFFCFGFSFCLSLGVAFFYGTFADVFFSFFQRIANMTWNVFMAFLLLWCYTKRVYTRRILFNRKISNRFYLQIARKVRDVQCLKALSIMLSIRLNASMCCVSLCWWKSFFLNVVCVQYAIAIDVCFSVSLRLFRFHLRIMQWRK